ncbi:hypothetical protein E0H56_21400 [Rhizobium leguminosarum bv. viciae]|nr:hypothetical protein [Rhizobium leguminosarum bv. viciae]RWX40642.1 hypothetical protein EHH54_11000 [Rhizobium leguminosarum]TAW54212.1 hypothetical protein ELI14_24350 [Rhizobium leguminosarum]TBE56923.1 hypothetical protein ELH04_22020 [Rhizobium leguminosarum]TBZ50434.1 hypothetical protein E0H44_07055 [Rhizobium leguminosarum bv. viciae]
MPADWCSCSAHPIRPIGHSNQLCPGRRLQRRASLKTRKGRCSTLSCCIISSSNRFRFKGIMQSQSLSAGNGACR